MTAFRIPPLADRLTDGRPVMTREQLVALAHRIARMTTMDEVSVSVTHQVDIVTHLAHDHVLSSEDGDTLRVGLFIALNNAEPPILQLSTNQLDDRTLSAAVQQLEMMIAGLLHYNPDRISKNPMRIQENFVPVSLWHDTTVQAMTTTRDTVIPALIDPVRQAQLSAAGFLGLTARAQAFLSKKDGVIAFSEETDSEVTVTARTKDGTRTGWGGVTARDWTKLPYATASEQAIRMATMCPGPPVAVEPGRRTAIFASTASIHLLRLLDQQFHAWYTDQNSTALSKDPHGNRLHQRVLDPRITMTSDPADPEGGYCPYFDAGFPTPRMTWIKDGILKNLAYEVDYGLQRGKPYAALPSSFRLSIAPTPPLQTVEQMIASCKEGIFVNRVSNVSEVDRRSGLLTGVTRDGCFLVKDGKVTKAVKNFRFLDSPFFFLNQLVAAGKPERAAFGWTEDAQWPLPPIIAPPMMVHDFNLSSLADAI